MTDLELLKTPPNIFIAILCKFCVV